MNRPSSTAKAKALSHDLDVDKSWSVDAFGNNWSKISNIKEDAYKNLGVKERVEKFLDDNPELLKHLPKDIEKDLSVMPIKGLNTSSQTVLFKHQGISVRGNMVVIEDKNGVIIGVNNNISQVQSYDICSSPNQKQATQLVLDKYPQTKIIQGPLLQYMPASGAKAMKVFRYIIEKLDKDDHGHGGEHLPQSEVLVYACEKKFAKYAYFH